MTEKTSTEILLEYATKYGLVYETSEDQKNFVLSPNDPIRNTKYVIFKKDNLYYCAYDSYGAKAGMSNTTSGVYSLINLPPDKNCRINKKNWLDRFLRQKKIKTGINYIDDNLTVTSESGWNPADCLSIQNVTLFQTISETISPLEIIIGEDHLGLISDLKGRMIVGLETNEWIYKPDDVKLLFESGGELIRGIKSCFP